MFPGQGSQALGMGINFYENFEIAKRLGDEASNFLNWDFISFLKNGPKETLKKTNCAQIALFVVSCMIFKVIKTTYSLNSLKFVLGHSVGEYAALYAASVFDFKEGLYLVQKRGESMIEASNLCEGKMLAVLGLTEPLVIELVEKINDFHQEKVLCIANKNSKEQFVLSGLRSAINHFLAEAKNQKCKCIPLEVSGAFHSHFMKSAKEKMNDVIDAIPFKKPTLPVVMNASAEAETDPLTIKKHLISNITGTVLWQTSIDNLIKKGLARFIEIGSGKVLSNLVKRINPQVFSCSIQSQDDLQQLPFEFL
jgi:[acyl-carrier-protein] S-malonyltransferase